ncbi:MAG: hypothetical protein K6C32_03560 [Bacilli bacterium]|nr:hypothetical protein [Bacilli bacterium]
MSKITRRSYKRKKIIMGAALFGAIGLVSTGFAAWVLSAPAVQDKTANLSVGVVDDKNMQFEDVVTYKTGDANKVSYNTYHFEPLADDDAGRVRFGGENPQMLSLTVEGTLSHVQNLGTLTAIISVTNKADDFAEALTKEYVVAPEAYNGEVTLFANGAIPTAQQAAFTQTTTGDADKTMVFTYEVKFDWGDFFEGMNPGLFFDDTTAGLAYQQGSNNDSTTADTVAGHLKDLHDLLDGVQLQLTLTAEPN